MSFLILSKLWMQYWTALKSREFDELVIEVGGDGIFFIILKCGVSVDKE